MKIKGIEVNDKLLKAVPMLESSTSKTIKILCEQIKKYFHDKQIEVETNYIIE